MTPLLKEHPSLSVGELKNRISDLETLYAELFADYRNTGELKRIHLQLEALKLELMLREN